MVPTAVALASPRMQIKPGTFGDNLNSWFRSLASNWRTLAIAALFAHVPLGVVIAVVFWLTGAAESLSKYLDPELVESMTEGEVLETLPPLLLAVTIWAILQLVAMVFVFIAATKAVVDDMAGTQPTWRAVIRHATGSTASGLVASLVILLLFAVVAGVVFGFGWALLSTLGATFLSVFLTTVLVLTGVVVLTWVGLSVSLAIQVISIEAIGPFSALPRSFSLVQGRWWITFGFLATAGLIASAVSQALSLALSPVVFLSLFVPQGLALAFGVSVILQGLLFAGIGAAYAVWYVDLRARHEALMTEQLA